MIAKMPFPSDKIMSSALLFPSGDQPMRLLAIGVEGFWKRSIEAARLPSDPAVAFVQTPRDSFLRLVSASLPFSHVLLPSPQSPETIAMLLSLTSGDAGYRTRLVLLDPSGPAPKADWLTISRDEADRLGAILRHDSRNPPPPGEIDFSGASLLSLIASDALEIRYQPMIRLSDRCPMAFEALARLKHPAHGMLSAEQFVPLAEKLGLSPGLTQAIGDRMMRDLAATPTASRLPTGLNFSLDVMLIDGTLDILEAQREAAGIAVEHLAIELTESRPAQDFAALRRALDRLRRAGYNIALDDIGPSLPRLAELLDLPFTAVKLDKSIVHHARPSTRTADYTARLIDACKSRDLLIIAEGAERESDLTRMKSIGADWAQGYFIARPLPAGAVPIWQQAWNG